MNKIIDKVSWIHIKDKELLLLKERGSETYCLPSSPSQEGESNEQVLCREIQAKLSVELTASTIEKIGIFCAHAEGQTAYVQLQMHCHFAQYQGELRPDKNIEEIRFVRNLDRSLCSAVAQVTMAWLREQDLIH